MGKFTDYMSDMLEYNIGDIVYLTTDPEQLERVIYAITIYPDHVVYNIAQGVNTSGHMAFEITQDKRIF